MSKIIELRGKRAKVWEEAKAFLDERRGEDGLLSAEDTATYEKMETEVVNLGKEIERLERQAAIDLELAKATSQALKTIPGAEAEKEGRAFQRLNELYAANGQVGFRATQRVDGKLILKEAVKILKMKA